VDSTLFLTVLVWTLKKNDVEERDDHLVDGDTQRREKRRETSVGQIGK